MKRDQVRFVLCVDEWQQMHIGMSKIDVHHIGTAPAENGNEHLIFAAINERRAAFDELHPPVAEQIAVWPRNSFDVVKAKASGVLDLLCHDEGLGASKRCYLPVDVQHLRLQKGCAITGNDTFSHGRRLSVGELAPLV